MEKEKKDIFDRMMGWGFLKTFEPFYKAHKEVLLYLFFGGLTTVVSVIFFAIPMNGAKPVAKECAAFFAGRLFTLVVETLLLNVMTTTLKMQEIIAKIIVSIVTIILNYIISKLFVFKKEKE